MNEDKKVITGGGPPEAASVFEEQALPAVNESRRFTLPEFLILLSLCADRHVFFYEGTEEVLTRETVIPAVQKLLLGGLLSMSGEHYILSEEGHRWMDGIGRSDRTAALRGTREEQPSLLLYYGSSEEPSPDAEITAVRYMAEEGDIEISCFRAGDLEEMLTGWELLPELPEYRQDAAGPVQEVPAPEGQILPGPEDPVADWRQIEGTESYAAVLACEPEREGAALLAKVIALRAEGRMLLGLERGPESGIRWLEDGRAARILTGREVMRL